jgi:hypothetical protein
MLVGCSSRGVYEGIQTSNRNECAMLPQSQYDECMERASVSYDDYQREREAAESSEKGKERRR